MKTIEDLKHTPGEWVIKHSKSEAAYNIVGTRIGETYKIAKIPYIECGFENKWLTEKHKSQSLVNATLIKAAPQMFQTLIELRSQLIDKGFKESGLVVAGIDLTIEKATKL